MPRDQLSASSCNINGSSRYSSYWYMYMYIHVPLGDFIVSTLLMAFQCIFSLPVSRRIPRMSWASWWVVGGGVGGWGVGVLFPDLTQAYTTNIAVYSLSIIGDTVPSSVTLATCSFPSSSSDMFTISSYLDHPNRRTLCFGL